IKFMDEGLNPVLEARGCFCVCSRCRSYEDCCGTRCCVRALSIQRLWYFW
uniref:Uncharacterized protein n=1 Tax=Myripristis murdjan TaxID=586833 RepID=A0A668B058_9TELE